MPDQLHDGQMVIKVAAVVVGSGKWEVGTHSSISLYMGVGRLSCAKVFHSSDVQMLW